MKTDTKVVLQGHAAGLAPCGRWIDMSVASIVWVMRWAAKGLTPVRPFVITTGDIKFFAG